MEKEHTTFGESRRPSGDGGTTNDDGWLQAFLRRLIPLETTFVVVKRRDLVLQRRQEKQYQPLPQGHGQKALLCKIRAKAGGYDLVVFMADADSNKRRDWRRTHSDISNGFDRVPGPNGVPCVPMSTSESWLLSDGQAWRGVGLTKLTMLPKKPEKIWGSPNDHNGNHPHQVFRRVCDAAGVQDGTANPRSAGPFIEPRKLCGQPARRVLLPLSAIQSPRWSGDSRRLGDFYVFITAVGL